MWLSVIAYLVQHYFQVSKRSKVSKKKVFTDEEVDVIWSSLQEGSDKQVCLQKQLKYTDKQVLV